MVSNSHMMDGQRQHYIPGPPPPPPQQQQQQGNLSHLPPPPPRLPPPPSLPHPSTLPPGTVYGFQPGWQQSWGQPGLRPGLPPPPPINHGQMQNSGYGIMQGRQPGQLNIPPPPPQYDKPLLSATFIPGGDSFGPGVGIPPFEDYTSLAYWENGTPTSDQTPMSQSTDTLNREARSASASSTRASGPGLRLALRESSPVSPGPPTATLQNPQPPTARSEGNTPVLGARQRAQSAAVGHHNDFASQWPLSRVIQWLAANGFSNEWQETFKTLHLEGSDFLELGKGGRGHLGKMYQVIYPQLAKISQSSNISGWDPNREIEEAKKVQKQRDEGKRLRKLIATIVDGDTGANSAGSGHRRRESTLVTSASTDGNVENSPHLGSVQAVPNADSPGKQVPPSLMSGFGPRGSHGRSSTLPVHAKQVSTTSNSTPSDSRHPDSFGGQGRSNFTREVLNGLGSRGRHSPGLSGDSSQGLGLRQMDGSPGGSPVPAHAVPAPAASAPNLLAYRSDYSKANSSDSMLKSRGSSGNLMSADTSGSGRFYENRGQDASRNSPLEASRNYPYTEYTPGPGGKDQSKNFLSKFMNRGRKQDTTNPSLDDQSLESPTSPAWSRQPSLISGRGTNGASGNEPASAQRPASANTGFEADRFETKPRRSDPSTRRFIFVTPDNWNYRLIDVTDIDSAGALRSKIVEELGISAGENMQVFVTEPGQVDHDEVLNDTSLVAAQMAAENTGSIKLYVQVGPSSTVSAPTSNGHPMTTSISAGGVNRDPYPNAPEFATQEALQKAAIEWRRQAELKQRAYLESRHKISERNSSIRGTKMIDFDSPRVSPYEDKKMDSLVPVRKAPPAPSESTTLNKVNSLRIRPGDGRAHALQRLSDPIIEDDDRGRKRRSGGPSSGGSIGAALANVGKIAGAPATHGGQSRGSDTGALARPDFTWAKGNLQFKVPDYEQDVGGLSGFAKPRNPALDKVRNRDPSPVSPSSNGYSSRPMLGREKSFGGDHEFKETNVSFLASPNPQNTTDSDDESDDGLFAIPLTNKSGTKDDSQDQSNKDRPTLKVDTDQHPNGRKVAFRSPGTANEAAGGQVWSGEDSAGPSDRSATERTYSYSSGGVSASPTEKSRPESFISDIWANRPAVENVVDHLDAFFPGVDLDRPYAEESGENGTPTTATDRPESADSATLNNAMPFSSPSPFDFSRKRNESDTLGSDESTLKESNKNKVVSFAKRQMDKSGGAGLGRAKSIRQRAQKANETHHVPSVRYQNNQATGIARRKSTKMFGANIVQIKAKPGNRVSILDPIPQEETPSEGVPKRQATFKIIRGQLIGKGTYGRVYLGMNANTGEFLAVKQVEVNHKAAGQDKDRIKEMVAALDQEIDTMQHLEHPNIVQYLGCERKEFSISIYLEYIPGGSIGSCLRKHGKFEESVVRSLTQQTLDGLAYLHRESILHRDLKADNILLDLDGTSKISDFGISKKSDNIYGNDVTNSMQGSVFWMAPEVVRAQGQGYSAKVDIWSLGCVVLEMFAGKRPWSRDEAIGAIFKLGSLNQAPPIPDDVQQTASVDGLNFMYDCFQVDPNDRPTAATLLKHSSFCVKDPYYNFYDTNLAAKLRTSDAAPTGL